jgi:hypothetical protein
MKLGGTGALLLLISMFLPWYQKSFFATSGPRAVAVTDNMNAFQVFSFVEAAVMLVAVAIIYLLWARMNNRQFRLPGSDGTVLLLAGSWSAFLLMWRLFDRPHVDDPAATVGIHWGIFVALVGVGVLITAGVQMRSLYRTSLEAEQF